MTVWDIAKWPVLLVSVLFMFAVLYYSAPNAKLRGFKWVTPGSLLAIVVWLLASRWIRLLRRELRLLQQDLRGSRRRDRIPGLALADQRGDPAGRGAQRRARAQSRTEEGVPGAERELQLGHRSEPKAKRRARTA